MNATLLFFAIALSLLPLIAGECPDPSGSVYGQVVNRTHHLITLCWVAQSTAIDSFQVNVRCQRGEETLVLVSDKLQDQEVNLTLECGYLCNASLTTNTLFGSHPETPLPSFSTIEPLEAPNITGVVVQDSVLTVVFADKAVICSNSSWEVCVTVDGRDETEHCSSQSAEDRLMTVDGGKGNVYSVRARVLFGDRHSPYSETTQLSATSVLPRDQLTLSNIGLPDVQLCYELNLPSLKKVSSFQPKHFVVHYMLCGSVDERSSNLSVNGTCQDLHGWLGGHCYEVQLFLTLDIDGLEISLSTTAVRKGSLLTLISLAAIPVLLIVVGCLLCAVWAKRSSVRNSNKTGNYPLQIPDLDIPVWDQFWSPVPIEPGVQTPVLTVGSEFGASDDEDHGQPESYNGDTEFGKPDPLGPKYNFQVTDSDYVYVRSILRPSTSAPTNSGMSQSIMPYNKEPSLLNFSSGE